MAATAIGDQEAALGIPVVRQVGLDLRDRGVRRRNAIEPRTRLGVVQLTASLASRRGTDGITLDLSLRRADAARHKRRHQGDEPQHRSLQDNADPFREALLVREPRSSPPRRKTIETRSHVVVGQGCGVRRDRAGRLAWSQRSGFGYRWPNA